jgi:hypothetical protein
VDNNLVQQYYKLMVGGAAQAAFQQYMQAYEALRANLETQLPLPCTQGTEWANDAQDAAISQARFWFTWGN